MRLTVVLADYEIFDGNPNLSKFLFFIFGFHLYGRSEQRNFIEKGDGSDRTLLLKLALDIRGFKHWKDSLNL